MYNDLNFDEGDTEDVAEICSICGCENQNELAHALGEIICNKCLYNVIFD